MYIIIIGGGRVGYYLTKALLDENHEVLIIEKNAALCNTIKEEMGSICLQGDGCEAATLEEVGTGRADMFVAVTGDDEDNLVACQVAKHKFNVPCTIARIRNPQNEALFKKLGIDVTVSTTDIILEYIEKEVPTHPLTHLLTLSEQDLEIVKVRIPPAATTVNKSVRELPLPKDNKLILVISRDRKPRIPTANTVLREGDQIVALTSLETEQKLRAALTST
ncbi:MAG: portal protein [Dehalococcoidales bacterium]|jgi:trk system potassium uptake protein TrkA|nr:portal protein [Dehalococcoidales bacterium]MDP6576868.1 TrkA family potassium uptake protein [Dehalococcoidales bacterium]|tara:strand:- start:2991 stop:3653 length:663 start_codon:yes stop_codon:yes gene_type:complete